MSKIINIITNNISLLLKQSLDFQSTGFHMKETLVFNELVLLLLILLQDKQKSKIALKQKTFFNLVILDLPYFP